MEIKHRQNIKLVNVAKGQSLNRRFHTYEDINCSLVSHMDFFQSFPPPLVSVTTNLHETIQDQTWAIRDNPQRCICPPSCSVHPVPGLGSSKRLIGSESTVSYVAASAASAVVARHSYICRTMCHCRWTITFVITRITYCTVSFLHLQQPHKTTIFDSELAANNYCNILDIWLTPIL